MSTQLSLTGVGAAYVRVSHDEQDPARQYTALRTFEKRHGVTIAPQHWYKDEGWSRDTAEIRPDFQRMLRAAEAGEIKWVVVSERDRFGTKDSDELGHYRYLFRKWGCKLYDADGTDWTKKDIVTVIHAAVEGEKSEKEQHDISRRMLGNKAEFVEAGEWQGGFVGLGLDVACFRRRPEGGMEDEEQWRVVCLGRHRWLKVYADGREESFEGEGNFPPHRKKTEALLLVPSRDKAKTAAVRDLFERYAGELAEAVNFTTLAHDLNRLGFRTSQGGLFQGNHIQRMLADPIYAGRYAWNKARYGKYHRYKDGGTVLEPNEPDDRGKRKISKNDVADWVRSRKEIEPIVSPELWEAVQRKLAARTRRKIAPRSAAAYLSGLVRCGHRGEPGHCGEEMYAGPISGSDPPRQEYFCSTYHNCIRDPERGPSPCLRHGVHHDELEGYLEKALEEMGLRLDLLTGGNGRGGKGGKGGAGSPWRLLDKHHADLDGARAQLEEGLDQLTGWLAEHRPADYAALLKRDWERAQEEAALWDEGEPMPPGAFLEYLRGRGIDPTKPIDTPYNPLWVMPDFAYDCFELYRAVFDPTVAAAELAKLDAEHGRQMEKWDQAPTPLYKEKAKARLDALEGRIQELKRQQQDAAQVVAAACREVHQFQERLYEARDALGLSLGGARSERELRRLTEKLQAVFERIECHFEVRGTSGRGLRSSDPVEVTFHPHGGGPPLVYRVGPAAPAGPGGGASGSSGGPLLRFSARAQA
jgi:DNA invertase Pin-like site-specific DNA recombinase